MNLRFLGLAVEVAEAALSAGHGWPLRFARSWHVKAAADSARGSAFPALIEQFLATPAFAASLLGTANRGVGVSLQHSWCRQGTPLGSLAANKQLSRSSHGAAAETSREVLHEHAAFSGFQPAPFRNMLLSASEDKEWAEREILEGQPDDRCWGGEGADSLGALDLGGLEDWQLQRERKREEERYLSMPQDLSCETVTPTAPSDYMMPIKAYYIARSINSKELMAKVYSELKPTHIRNNVALRFSDRPENSPPAGMKPGLPHVPDRWMVAFDFGAVVFFNFEDAEINAELEKARRFTSNPFKKEQAKLEDFALVVRPSLPGWSAGGPDHIMIKKVDENNVRIISSVIAQSVALDHYISQVDGMLATFGEINAEMERTGDFAIKRQKLFQLVATINTTLSDVMIKLELLNRQETAWKYAQYGKIWEFLRDDFDITARFEGLNFKLNVIQQNVKFFLGVLQNRKSDLLEWIIILLIAGEICLGLYEIFHRV